MSQESRKLEEWRLLKCIPADSGEESIQGVTHLALSSRGGDPEGELISMHVVSDSLSFH